MFRPPAEGSGPPAETLSIPAEALSTPARVPNAPAGVRNAPAETLSTPAEALSTPAGVPNTPAGTPSTAAGTLSTPAEALSTSAEVPNVPADVPDIRADLWNLLRDVSTPGFDMFRSQLATSHPETPCRSTSQARLINRVSIGERNLRSRRSCAPANGSRRPMPRSAPDPSVSRRVTKRRTVAAVQPRSGSKRDLSHGLHATPARSLHLARVLHSYPCTCGLARLPTDPVPAGYAARDH